MVPVSDIACAEGYAGRRDCGKLTAEALAGLTGAPDPADSAPQAEHDAPRRHLEGYGTSIS